MITKKHLPGQHSQASHAGALLPHEIKGRRDAAERLTRDVNGYIKSHPLPGVKVERLDAQGAVFIKSDNWGSGVGLWIYDDKYSDLAKKNTRQSVMATFPNKFADDATIDSVLNLAEQLAYATGTSSVTTSVMSLPMLGTITRKNFEINVSDLTQLEGRLQYDKGLPPHGLRDQFAVDLQKTLARKNVRPEISSIVKYAQQEVGRFVSQSSTNDYVHMEYLSMYGAYILHQLHNPTLPSVRRFPLQFDDGIRARLQVPVY